MYKNIKDILRQFVISFVALGAVLLFATAVSAYTSTWTAPTASFPGNNVTIAPAGCSSTDGTKVLMSDANGNIVCGSAVPTYQ